MANQTDAEALRRRSMEESETRQRQADAPDVRLSRPGLADALALPAESPCFTLTKIDLQLPPEAPTTSLAPFAFVAADLQRYLGQCAGQQGLQQIAKRANALLLSAGYTTSRILVADQDMSGGVLHLSVLPGRIGAIRFREETNLSWRTAFPCRPGDLLNLRDLEQGLEQMKRVVSQDIDMQVEPGANTGESDIVIALRQEKPWRLSVGLDDSGYRSTGKLQTNVNLSLDNIFNLNDILSIGGNSDAERRSGRRGGEGANFQYSIPTGYWTWTLSAGQSTYRQVIQGTNQEFLSSGISETAEFRSHWVFDRDQFSKSSLQFRVGRRWSHSFLNDTEIVVQKRNTTYGELSLQHRRNIGAAQVDINLASRHGTSWFGAQEDQAGLASDSPRFGYALQTLDVNVRVPFTVAGTELRYNGALRAQTSRNTLYATEQFLIGNRWTVRGFDGQSSLAAEKGYYFRNDLELPFGSSGYAAYLGVDTGAVAGPSARNLVGSHLAGAVIGLRGSPAKDVWFDLFVGHAIAKPTGFHTAQPAVGFSLNFQL